MAQLKTQPTDADARSFVDRIADPKRRADALWTLSMMARVTGEEPRLWGSSMIGFGTYHYKYASGREGDWFVTGFSPRKQALTLYVMTGFEGAGDLLARLGKHSTGVSCLYLKSLDDVDRAVLTTLVERSVKAVRERADGRLDEPIESRSTRPDGGEGTRGTARPKAGGRRPAGKASAAHGGGRPAGRPSTAARGARGSATAPRRTR